MQRSALLRGAAFKHGRGWVTQGLLVEGRLLGHHRGDQVQRGIQRATVKSLLVAHMMRVQVVRQENRGVTLIDSCSVVEL